MTNLQRHKDKQLLLKLRRDDVKAFDELYHRYARKMMGFAFTFFHRREVAEEAVQEIFVRIWERRKELDPEKSFKTYLFQAVKFYMYNYIRDKKSTCMLNEVPDGTFLRERDAEDDLVFRELEAATFALIEKLPEVQREVFKKNKLEGKSAAEIASQMKLSKRTIEHHIYLATKTLKGGLLQHSSFAVVFFVCLWF